MRASSFSSLAVWAGAAAPAANEEDLKALRSRIDALQRELEQKEEVAQARRATRCATPSARSRQANRALAELAGGRTSSCGPRAAAIAERRAAWSARSPSASRRSSRMLAAQQASRRARRAARGALRRRSRRRRRASLHYVGYLVARRGRAARRATAPTLAEARAPRRAKRRRSATRLRCGASRRAAPTVRSSSRERRERAAGCSTRVAGEIRKSRSEIKVLRADEARLARLVEELAARAGRREAIPKKHAEPSPACAASCSLPVRGELTGRFGAPRGAAGIEAKGLFIRAPQGQPVRAIAAGQVVYADWMRGFGNLLIRGPRRELPVDLREQRVAAEASGRCGDGRRDRRDHRGERWQRGNGLIL